MDFSKLNILKPLIRTHEYAKKAEMYCRFCEAPVPQEVTDILTNYDAATHEVADYLFSLLPEAFQEYCRNKQLNYSIYTGNITGEHMALELRFNFTCSSSIKWDMDGNMYIDKHWIERDPTIPTEGLKVVTYFPIIYYHFDKE